MITTQEFFLAIRRENRLYENWIQNFMAIVLIGKAGDQKTASNVVLAENKEKQLRFTKGWNNVVMTTL